MQLMMTLGRHRTSGCIPHDLDKSSTFTMIDPAGTSRPLYKKSVTRENLLSFLSDFEWDIWTFQAVYTAI